KLDNNKALAKFVRRLEKSCVETVDDGHLTKDLAGCIHGLKNLKEGDYLYTMDFLDAIVENLEDKLGDSK
ncbi:unnamed protein product, partial [Oppiella nova]